MASLIVTILVALAHVGFMVLETFLWTTPAVRRIFGQTSEQAETTKLLAANQGIYNGAIAAALLWAAWAGHGPTMVALLGIVVVVGIYGGFTAKRSIIVIQALPAALALALRLAGW